MTWTMSFKSGYHSDTLQSKDVIVKHSSEKLYKIDIKDTKTPSGNIVKVYSAEIMSNYKSILQTIGNNHAQNSYWKRYSSKNQFSNTIEFQSTVDSAMILLDRSL